MQEPAGDDMNDDDVDVDDVDIDDDGSLICLSDLLPVTGMVADMPSHIRTLFLFLGSVRIPSFFASFFHHSHSVSIHSCLRSYRREYNKGISLILP
jgi:hypothetical protein